MHTKSIEPWTHDHTFGQDTPRAGERRTLVVIALTTLTMGAEAAAGLLFGSMALLADGLHMASHSSALAVSAFAYRYTRRHARDPRFNFGTGKVNDLAAFASAALLMVFAVIMAWESVERLAAPVPIEFNQALLVAVLGLAVNGACLVILKSPGHSHDGENHGHRHKGEVAHPHEGHGDHNLWSAYLHVLADALTSVLAIVAPLVGKYGGLMWMDPLMGVVGAFLVAHWSFMLARSSAHILLDMRAPQPLHQTIQDAIEREGDNRIADLHVWAVGPDIFAAAMTVVTSTPHDPDHYRERLPKNLGLVHVNVEVRDSGQGVRP